MRLHNDSPSSKNWKADAEFHWHECSDCDELFDKALTTCNFWFEGSELRGRGYVTYKCSVCGYTKRMRLRLPVCYGKHNAMAATAKAARPILFLQPCGKFYPIRKANTKLPKTVGLSLRRTYLTCWRQKSCKTETDPKTITTAKSAIQTYADAAATQEITDGVEIKQLVQCGKQNNACGIGIDRKRRSCGVTTTQASLNLINAMPLKMNLAMFDGAKRGQKRCFCFGECHGYNRNIIMPFEKEPFWNSGNRHKNFRDYACVCRYVYLLYTDGEEELILL